MRYKIILLIALLLAQIVEAEYSNKIYIARRVQGASPTIDGVIASSEWSPSNTYYADSFIMYPPQPSNPKNFFTLRLLFDDQYLYIAVRVNDKVYTPRPNFENIDTHDYLVLAFNQRTGGGGLDSTRNAWDFAMSLESRTYKASYGYYYLRPDRGGIIQWYGAGDIGYGAVRYNVDHYDCEARIKLDSSANPSTDGTFMKINPYTDVLGMTFSFHNNDGQCIPDGFGGCGRTDEVDVGEYHTLSYNYSSYEGNNEISTKHHPVFTSNVAPWQRIVFNTGTTTTISCQDACDWSGCRGDYNCYVAASGCKIKEWTQECAGYPTTTPISTTSTTTAPTTTTSTVAPTTTFFTTTTTPTTIISTTTIATTITPTTTSSPTTTTPTTTITTTTPTTTTLPSAEKPPSTTIKYAAIAALIVVAFYLKIRLKKV